MVTGFTRFRLKKLPDIFVHKKGIGIDLLFFGNVRTYTTSNIYIYIHTCIYTSIPMYNQLIYIYIYIYIFIVMYTT